MKKSMVSSGWLQVGSRRLLIGVGNGSTVGRLGPKFIILRWCVP